MYVPIATTDNPREQLAKGSFWAALIILLFGLTGCQPVPGSGGDHPPDCGGTLCGSGVDDPDGGNPGTDGGDDGGGDGGTGVGGSPDVCAEADAIDDEGEFDFDNTSATQDGPAHGACTNHDQDQIDRDLWYCWTAECTSLVVVETCGRTELDTRIAVYEGCECPPSSDRLLECADDDCGVQTRAMFDAVQGRRYLIRVGTYPPGALGGPGAFSVRCGFANCPGAGDCDAAHGGLGCENEQCCNAVCRVDSVCCLENWDDICVQEAAALCNGGFDSCAAGAGSCRIAKSTPGCEPADCCNAVCRVDTYCCLNEWDEECVALEARTCFSACTVAAGDCDSAHPNAGCRDPACCAEVCPRDLFCCTTEWDAGCATMAAEYCAQASE
jgi:hypothetical protein